MDDLIYSNINVVDYMHKDPWDIILSFSSPSRSPPPSPSQSQPPRSRTRSNSQLSEEIEFLPRGEDENRNMYKQRKPVVPKVEYVSCRYNSRHRVADYQLRNHESHCRDKTDSDSISDRDRNGNHSKDKKIIPEKEPILIPWSQDDGRGLVINPVLVFNTRETSPETCGRGRGRFRGGRGRSNRRGNQRKAVDDSPVMVGDINEDWEATTEKTPTYDTNAAPKPTEVLPYFRGSPSEDPHQKQNENEKEHNSNQEHLKEESNTGNANISYVGKGWEEWEEYQPLALTKIGSPSPSLLPPGYGENGYDDMYDFGSSPDLSVGNSNAGPEGPIHDEFPLKDNEERPTKKPRLESYCSQEKSSSPGPGYCFYYRREGDTETFNSDPEWDMDTESPTHKNNDNSSSSNGEVDKENPEKTYLDWDDFMA